MMNRQQADAMQRENDARNRAERQRQDAGWARSRASADAQRAANDRAQRDHYHQQTMKNIAEGGRRMREAQSGWFSSPSRGRNDETSSTNYSGGKGKSKGGGLFALLVVIGVVVAVANSDSSNSRKAPAPVVNSYADSNTSTTSAPASPSPKPLADVANTDATASAAAPQPLADGPKMPETPEPVAPGASATPESTFKDATSGLPTQTTDTAATPPASTTPAPPPVTPAILPAEPVYRVGAIYPAEALQTRPTGLVLVDIWVQSNGRVASVKALSGDPLLVPAALAAGRQWMFRPYPPEPGKPMRRFRVNFEFEAPATYSVRR